MVQGTGSHVGKSVIATALCALFTQQGHRVAPFKSQNMALNSAVAADGGEIGRAQAAQAAACGIEPTTDMNPILLKPTGERKAQVIVRGRPIGELDGAEYRARREEMLGIALEALDSLREEFDIVVIEGAGSPAEVNLRSGDIVNMEIARAAEAPVILVTDIDRGGAFASLVGTMSLLTWHERRRVRGIIINKFRGDKDLLKDAIDFIEARSGAPVIGVVPWMRDIGIDAEDSVSLEENEYEQGAGGADVAVIKLPFISNFTDFNPLAEAGAAVRYVRSAEELGNPDAVIIPGTKDTLNDLRFLQESGLSSVIVSKAESGTPVIGICGGYQMLGRELVGGRNGEADRMAGLGLLPVQTVMSDEKITVNASGVTATLPGRCRPLSGHSVGGYEIHHGRTEALPKTSPFLEIGENGNTRADGACHETLPVFGTYMHGLFDSRAFTRTFVEWIQPDADKRGLSAPVPPGEGIEGFAEVVGRSLDMRAVTDLLSESSGAADLLPPPALHGGRAPQDTVDLSENVNLLGPSKAWWNGVLDSNSVSTYRQETEILRVAAARRYGVPESCVVCGAGSAELIYRLVSLLQPAKALVVEPTFAEYARAAAVHGASVSSFPLGDDFGLGVDGLAKASLGCDVVFLANPNNPTGNAHAPELLLRVSESLRGRGFLVIDEAFMDFVPGGEFSVADMVDRCDNLVVLRSMGKLYSLAGLRVGFLLTNEHLARQLNLFAPPWTVGYQTSSVAANALADDAFLELSIKTTSLARREAVSAVGALPGVTVYPSVANFILARQDDVSSGETLWKRLAADGFSTRDCGTFEGLGPGYARIAVGDTGQIRNLVRSAKRLLH